MAAASSNIYKRSQAESGGFISTLCMTRSSVPFCRVAAISIPVTRQRRHLETIQCAYQ